jgi:hypothetical protein
VRAGTMIIPPPTPSIEPNVPAASPTAARIITVVIGSNNDPVSLAPSLL